MTHIRLVFTNLSNVAKAALPEKFVSQKVLITNVSLRV